MKIRLHFFQSIDDGAGQPSALWRREAVCHGWAEALELAAHIPALSHPSERIADNDFFLRREKLIRSHDGWRVITSDRMH